MTTVLDSRFATMAKATVNIVSISNPAVIRPLPYPSGAQLKIDRPYPDASCADKVTAIWIFFTVELENPPFCIAILFNGDIMKFEPTITNESRSPGEDVEIIKLRQGVASATEEFVRKNIGWMLAVARRMLRNDAHAEDCVQDAFLNIFKNLESFRGESSLRTWMHRIVVNHVLMLLRSRKRLNEASIDDLLPDFDENGCRVEDRWSDFETPESLMERSQTKETVIALIGKLPDNYRIVLLLRDIEELSVSEVAEILNLSETNVKVRLHRARSALKKLLEPLLRGEKL